MNATPLVSTLTPSLNQGRWMPDALLSAAQQTYPRIEYILADGGLTDDTGLLSAAEGISWRSEPDAGQSDALNRAFSRSSGEIIGWLNADDAYFAADVVTDVVETFKRRPDAGVVYGHAVLVNAFGRVLQFIWVPPFSTRFLRGYNFVIQPAAFIRRAALGETFVDERHDFTMDQELWLRLARDWEFARLPRPLTMDRHDLQRKSINRPGPWAADTSRLGREYGVPQNQVSRFRKKLFKVGFRLVGLARLRTLQRTELAFDRHFDTPWRLALRQLAVPRARMLLESLL
jgi:glycosyltransferase involved in cell wall biosynthesis